MEIAIFGTSADPPTIAHQSILDYLAHRYDIVAVYASDNPFKADQSDLAHRNRMLELLIADLNSNNIILAPEISDRRSINTVAKVKQKWGAEHTLTMVIGSDLAKQIFSWYQAEKLWSKLKVLIIPRDGYELKPEIVEEIERRSLGCSVAQYQTPDYSSTDYRCDRDREVITDSVAEYISQHQLYS